MEDAREKDKLRKRDPRSKEKRKDSYLKRVYGITLEDYNKILADQNGQCFICKTSTCKSGYNFAVDHCHKTGKIRSLLCQSCNTLLGLANERVEVLTAAAEYLANSQRKSYTDDEEIEK